MKRVFVTAIACGVWLTGVTSAAALYAIDRAGTVPSSAVASYQPRHAAELTEKAANPDEELAVRAPIAVPVRRVAPVTRALPVEAPPHRDISQMVCAPARELDMGSGHVQICE
jgi:hypothetical protein